jgi:hypothetical protein
VKECVEKRWEICILVVFYLQWQAAISDVSMTRNLHLPLLPQNTLIWDETGQKLIALIDRIYLVD